MPNVMIRNIMRLINCRSLSMMNRRLKCTRYSSNDATEQKAMNALPANLFLAAMIKR